jgi:hypothetical protein
MRFAACSFGLSRKVKATYNLEQRSMYVANFSPGGFEQV